MEFFCTDLNTPILKVWGGASQGPLTMGIVNQQFPSLRGTTCVILREACETAFALGTIFVSLSDIHEVKLKMSYCNRDYDRSVGGCCHNALGLVRIGLGMWLRVRPLMHHDNKPLGPAFMPQTKSVVMTHTHLVYNWFRVNSKDNFNHLYNMDFRRQYICWSLRCSWNNADRRRYLQSRLNT